MFLLLFIIMRMKKRQHYFDILKAFFIRHSSEYKTLCTHNLEDEHLASCLADVIFDFYIENLEYSVTIRRFIL